MQRDLRCNSQAMQTEGREGFVYVECEQLLNSKPIGKYILKNFGLTQIEQLVVKNYVYKCSFFKKNTPKNGAFLNTKLKETPNLFKTAIAKMGFAENLLKNKENQKLYTVQTFHDHSHPVDIEQQH